MGPDTRTKPADFERVVIEHGAKAHWIYSHIGHTTYTFCMRALYQTRPALTRDKSCKRRARELRIFLRDQRLRKRRTK